MGQKLIFLDIDCTLTEPGKMFRPLVRWMRLPGQEERDKRWYCAPGAIMGCAFR